VVGKRSREGVAVGQTELNCVQEPRGIHVTDAAAVWRTIRWRGREVAGF